MKRTTIIITMLAGLALALTSVTPSAVCAAGCGIKPIKPIPPIGCKDLEAQCECDEQGAKCKWTWRCVR